MTRQGSQSFPCPKCEAGTVVKDTRPDIEGVRRRRACVECDFRFFTTEQNEMSKKFTTSTRAKLKLIERIEAKMVVLVELMDELRAEHD